MVSHTFKYRYFYRKKTKKNIYVGIPYVKIVIFLFKKTYMLVSHTSTYQYSYRKTIRFGIPYANVAIFFKENHTFRYPIRQNSNALQKNHTSWCPIRQNNNVSIKNDTCWYPIHQNNNISIEKKKHNKNKNNKTIHLGVPYAKITMCL